MWIVRIYPYVDSEYYAFKTHADAKEFIAKIESQHGDIEWTLMFDNRLNEDGYIRDDIEF